MYIYINIKYTNTIDMYISCVRVYIYMYIFIYTYQILIYTYQIPEYV